MKSAGVLVALLALLLVTACGSGPSPTLNVSGQWQFTATGSAGTLTLSQQDKQLTGSLSDPDYSNTQITGTLAGDSLTATITATYDGPDQCIGIVNPITISLSGTVAADGNSMSGQFVTLHTTCLGSGTWTATRM